MPDTDWIEMPKTGLSRRFFRRVNGSVETKQVLPVGRIGQPFPVFPRLRMPADA